MGATWASVSLLCFGVCALSADAGAALEPSHRPADGAAAVEPSPQPADGAAPHRGPSGQQASQGKPKQQRPPLRPQDARRKGSEADVFQPDGDLKRFGVEIVSPVLSDAAVGRINVRAEVDADQPAAVAAVDFFIDGRLMFSDSKAPYELLWRSPRPAPHVIEVRAYGPGRQMVSDVIEMGFSARTPDLRAFSGRVERVEVHVLVEDEDEAAANLGASSFEVLEDGVPQPIVAVERVADLPLAVALLIDHSGSMLEQLDTALEAAGSFIDGLLTHPNDKALVLGFADTPVVFQEFTDDGARLTDSISLIESGRNTALYDSIVAAAARFEGIDGRRAAIVLTDGADEGSAADLSEAIAAAQRADLALYPIAVELPPRYAMQTWILRRLARETGGRMFSLGRRDNPERIYTAIEDDLRAQYRVSYGPLVPGGGGEWRELEVRLRDNDDDRKVRARPGYFAR